MDMDLDDPRFKQIMDAYGEAMRSGRYKECETLFQELSLWLAEQIENDPEFICGWSFVASDCEENGDWEGAEAAYHEILTLNGDDWKTLDDLAGLCWLLGRHEEALDYARRATEVARVDDVNVLQAMALRREAAMHLDLGNLAAAESLVAEMFRVIEDDELCAQPRGAAYTLRARCRIQVGDLEQAARDLDNGFKQFQPMLAMESAAGLQADVARWYAAKGRLEAMRGNATLAREAWSEAIARTRHVVELWDGENAGIRAFLSQMLKLAAESLDRFGSNDQTAEMVAESREIWRSLRLPDEAW